MSAQYIYDTAPLGSLIRYSNGEPRPPERFRRKLAAWNNDNGTGAASNLNNAPNSGATPTGTQGLTFNRRSTVSLAGSWGELRLGINREYGSVKVLVGDHTGTADYFNRAVN